MIANAEGWPSAKDVWLNAKGGMLSMGIVLLGISRPGIESKPTGGCKSWRGDA